MDRMALAKEIDGNRMGFLTLTFGGLWTLKPTMILLCSDKVSQRIEGLVEDNGNKKG